jgi:hypothetical protein
MEAVLELKDVLDKLKRVPSDGNLLLNGFEDRLRIARVPRNPQFDERPATRSDFTPQWRELVGRVTSALSDALSVVPNDDQSRSILKQCSPSVLLLVGEQSADVNEPWVVPEAAERCPVILERLARNVFRVENVGEVLGQMIYYHGCTGRKRTLLVSCVELLKHQLAEDKWKANVAAPFVLEWLLRHARVRVSSELQTR